MQKLKKTLFAISFALAISSCNTLRKFPEKVDLCSAVKGNPNYVFCVSYYSNSNREYRLSQQEIFDRRYIMVSPEHYGEIRKYVEYLKGEASRRCK